MSYETDKQIFKPEVEDFLDEDIEKVEKRNKNKKKSSIFSVSEIDRLLSFLKIHNRNIKFKKKSDNEILVDKNDMDKKDNKLELPQDYTNVDNMLLKDGNLIATMNFEDIRKRKKDKKKKDKKEKRKLSFKFTNFFKKFKKTKDELPDEDIERVEKRKDKTKKFSLFKKLKRKKKNKNPNKASSSESKNPNKAPSNENLKDKILSYLDGVTYTIKDLIHILKKAEIIQQVQTSLDQLNEFINTNITLDKNKKLSQLVTLMSKLAVDAQLYINIQKAAEIESLLKEKGLDSNKEVMDLFNKIINYEEKLTKNINDLYDYISDNKETLDADSIINKMNQILGIPQISADELLIKELKEKLEAKEKELEKTKKELNSAKEELEKRNQKVDNSTENLTPQDEVEPFDIENQNEKIKKSLQLQKIYDRYNKIKKELNEKSSELNYLKQEYSIIEKSIYGENFNELSIDEKKEITLLTSKEKLELLKEKLEEIKRVKMEIDVLSSKEIKYRVEFGDIESKVAEDYSNLYNSLLFEKEEEDIRNKKMNDSKEFFNNFTDEEIQAINKYKKYEKTLN